MAVVPGGGDQGESALPLLAQFGQELGSGDEDRAGQAGVGMRALALDRQAAVAVGQRLGGDAVSGLRPLGLGERPVRVDDDPLAGDVDPGGLFPAAPDGLVGDLLWRSQISELSE
jgi:hypothetical protein